jgi:hypothetical protein
LTVATSRAFEVDTVLGLADGLNALCDLLALLGQARLRAPGRFESHVGVVKTHGRLGGTTRPALVGLCI